MYYSYTFNVEKTQKSAEAGCLKLLKMRMRMNFIARYVYTHEEFVIVTEAPQTGQDTDNKKNNIQI